MFPRSLSLIVLSSVLGLASIPEASATIAVTPDYVINFDSVADGSTANSAAPTGVSFSYAVFIPDQDGDGLDIPGTEKWHVDPGAPSVPVYDPTAFGGSFTAFSNPNAMDVRDQSALMQFATPQALGDFSLQASTFDNSTFGGATNQSILFLDSSAQIIGQASLASAGTGFSASLGQPLGSISAVMLPSGAFYDNISVTTVPVPAALPLFLSALGTLGFFRRRKISL